MIFPSAVTAMLSRLVALAITTLLLLDATMWPDQPLGRDVAGTEASVSALTREGTLNYLRRQYVPNNIVVSVAGAIEHEEVVGFMTKKRVQNMANSGPPIAKTTMTIVNERAKKIIRLCF